MSRSRDREAPLDLAVAFRFLRGLKKHNDRAWFHANRAAWDEHVRHGFEDLVTMLLLAGAQADDRLAHVDPRACLFRIANDTRFHKQKDPYKTWLSAWMSPGGKNGAYPGYYVHLAPGASHVSAGVWVPEKPSLHALRSTFAENGADARAFDRILASRAAKPYLPLETDAMRVTPRGFPKTHPRLPLIRARNYMLSRDVADAELQRRGAFAVFRDFIRDTAPFVRWLDAHAAAASESPFDLEE
ncbi:MAG TPA: TIGR02453 family protein [Candidatus Elarobacter sp.]|nr:TIGR02453 family protein [Candidatus Elarobacter sp.]